MARGGKVKRRDIKLDPLYKSELVARLIRSIMYSGKLSVATKIVYEAFNIISSKDLNPLDVYTQAFKNISPTLITRPRRVGGAIQQIPVEVDEHRASVLARQWLRSAARARNEKTMSEKLAAEILAAYQNTGAAIKKKEDNQKMAKSNNVFAPVL